MGGHRRPPSQVDPLSEPSVTTNAPNEQCGQQTFVPGDVVTLIPVRAWHDAGVDDAAVGVAAACLARHGLRASDGDRLRVGRERLGRPAGRVRGHGRLPADHPGDHAHGTPHRWHGGALGTRVRSCTGRGLLWPGPLHPAVVPAADDVPRFVTGGSPQSSAVPGASCRPGADRRGRPTGCSEREPVRSGLPTSAADVVAGHRGLAGSRARYGPDGATARWGRVHDPRLHRRCHDPAVGRGRTARRQKRSPA